TTFGTAPGDVLRAQEDIAIRIASVVVADPPPEAGDLPGESGSIVVEPPPDTKRLTLSKVAHAYGIDQVTATGAQGQGVTIGVVVAALFKFKDVQSFWQGQGI